MTSTPTPAPAPAAGRSRWIALIVISLAQLMVVLDGSIVNIALPQAQIDLGFDDSLRQWIVTAYSLTSGPCSCSAVASRTCGAASAPSSPA